MGIECDGPSYRQVATARDRDRLRDQVLRSLGWGVGHIWSADWLSNREGQLSRIDEQFQRLLIPIINPEPETLTTEPPEDDDAIDVEYEIASPSLRLTVSLPPTAAPVRRFSKIDDVPDGLLNETILDLIQKSGRSPEEGIIRSVAYSLGFNRVGRKIEERIKWSIKSLVRKWQVLRDEERFLLIP